MKNNSMRNKGCLSNAKETPKRNARIRSISKMLSKSGKDGQDTSINSLSRPYASMAKTGPKSQNISALETISNVTLTDNFSSKEYSLIQIFREPTSFMWCYKKQTKFKRSTGPIGRMKSMENLSRQWDSMGKTGQKLRNMWAPETRCSAPIMAKHL